MQSHHNLGFREKERKNSETEKENRYSHLCMKKPLANKETGKKKQYNKIKDQQKRVIDKGKGKSLSLFVTMSPSNVSFSHFSLQNL